MVGFGCGWHGAQFDNFKLSEKTGGSFAFSRTQNVQSNRNVPAENNPAMLRTVKDVINL